MHGNFFSLFLFLFFFSLHLSLVLIRRLFFSSFPFPLIDARCISINSIYTANKKNTKHLIGNGVCCIIECRRELAAARQDPKRGVKASKVVGIAPPPPPTFLSFHPSPHNRRALRVIDRVVVGTVHVCISMEVLVHSLFSLSPLPPFFLHMFYLCALQRAFFFKQSFWL